MGKEVRILGMRVNAVQIPWVIEYMERSIEKKEPGHYITVANTQSAVISKQCGCYGRAWESSSLCVPDGMPLVWMIRLNGIPLKSRVRGADLMLSFFAATRSRNYKHYFYGTTPDTLKKLTDNLKKLFPDAKVAGTYAPPFHELTREEDRKAVDEINKVSPDVIWVGLGCPKQEMWMYDHRGSVRAPLMVGVGAAFDFVSGIKPEAPSWMKNCGLEWFFRLLSEPGRLWRRYLYYNSLFLLYGVPEALLAVVSRPKKNAQED